MSKKIIHNKSNKKIKYDKNNFYDIFWKILISKKIDRVFGLPGGPIDNLLSAKPEEIFGIKKLNSTVKTYIKENSTFFDYLMIAFNNIFEKLLFIDNDIHAEIGREIKVSDVAIIITDILSTASSLEERQRLINRGVEIFKDCKFTEHI